VFRVPKIRNKIQRMSQNLLLISYKKASKNGNLNVPLHDVKHPKFFLQKPIKI
jgi:hypothetical protein